MVRIRKGICQFIRWNYPTRMDGVPTRMHVANAISLEFVKNGGCLHTECWCMFDPWNFQDLRFGPCFHLMCLLNPFLIWSCSFIFQFLSIDYMNSSIIWINYWNLQFGPQTLNFLFRPFFIHLFQFNQIASSFN